MNALKAFHHVGIVVKDLDQSIDFYHNTLGLEFASEPSPWTVGIKGASLRHARLKLADTVIELLEFGASNQVADTPTPWYASGVFHFAFQVDDIERTRRALAAKGVTFLSDVNVVDKGTLAGWRWTYFADPDGYNIELVELAYAREDERRNGISAYVTSRNWR